MKPVMSYQLTTKQAGALMPLILTNPIFGISFIVGYTIYKEMGKEN